MLRRLHTLYSIELFSLLLVVLLLHLYMNRAFACDLHMPITAADMGESRAGDFALSLSHQLTHYESNIRLEGFENFPGQHLESNISQISLAYFALDRLAFQLSLPFIYRDYRRVANDSIENGSESGIGDISLISRFQASHYHTEDYILNWEILAGVELPTGDSDRLEEEISEVNELFLPKHSAIEGALVGGEDLALGSGSVDWILGSNIFLGYRRFSFSSELQYVVRQSGDFSYHYGDDFQWAAAGSYHLLELGANNSSCRFFGSLGSIKIKTE